MVYYKERQKFLTPHSSYPPVWPEMKQTFGSFLLSRNLTAMHCVLTTYNEMFGYLPLNLMPAYYGLMFYDNIGVLDIIFLHKYLPTYKDNAELLTTLAAKMQLDIRLNTDISFIRRQANITIGYSNGTIDDSFGYLIWTPSLKLLPLTVADTTNVERHLANKMVTTNFSSVLFYSAEASSFANCLISDRELPLEYNTKDVVMGIFGVPEKAEHKGVAYIHLISNDLQIADIKQLMLSSPCFDEMKIWSYFHHFAEDDYGLIWDLFSLQGQNNMWIIGSSASFESVNSVVEYNDLIMKQWKH